MHGRNVNKSRYRAAIAGGRHQVGQHAHQIGFFAIQGHDFAFGGALHVERDIKVTHEFRVVQHMREIVNTPAYVGLAQLENLRGIRAETGDAKIGIDKNGGDTSRFGHAVQVCINAVEQQHLFLKLGVDRAHFLVHRLQLFVRALQFFVRGHQFFVSGLQFLIRGFQFFNRGLQAFAGRGELAFENRGAFNRHRIDMDRRRAAVLRVNTHRLKAEQGEPFIIFSADRMGRNA